MNRELLNNKNQNFIENNLNEDASKLILKGVNFPNVTIQELVGQIISKKKCQKKLPSWFGCKNIYYPNKLNIEQTSSEITAKYKATLISGKNLIDITGGLGVDCFAFADRFNYVTHCEINTELSTIVKHNFKQLGLKNIKTLAIDGLDYLRKINQEFDWIYIDPSRRDQYKTKVFLLKDCLPNIPVNLNFLFKHTENILLKLSPILDITSSIKTLNFVKEIHVIAVNNEVKELLFLLKKDYVSTIQIIAININNFDVEKMESNLISAANSTYTLPQKYLYEPNAAILKAGLFNEVSEQLKLDKLHNNSHLYTSKVLITFPGRRFLIRHAIPYDKKKINELIPLKKANITTRNFPESVSQIRKKTKIKEGGDVFMFFTTDMNNKLIVLICIKV